MKLAVLTVFAQNTLGRPTFNPMHLTLSAKVLFILSTTPFCCGVLLTVKWQVIPSNSQNLMNSLFLYSRPLSILRYIVFLPVWFSTYAFHFLNMPNTSDLCFIKCIQPFWSSHQWNWWNTKHHYEKKLRLVPRHLNEYNQEHPYLYESLSWNWLYAASHTHNTCRSIACISSPISINFSCVALTYHVHQYGQLAYFIILCHQCIDCNFSL